MTPNSSEIAELVNQLFQDHRKTDGQMYSNNEVANALGVHPSYIGKLRGGKVPNPGRDTLKELCIFFHVPSSHFFPELDTLEAPSKEANLEINLRSTLREFGLDEESQFYIEGLIKRLRGKSNKPD